MKKALIIGGGIAGCSAGYFLNKKKFKVDLVEKSNIIGAGNKTHWFGGHPHTFGPRHIITKNKTVYNFLHNLFPLRKLNNYKLLSFQHQEKKFFHYPLNVNEFDHLEDKNSVLSELKEIKKIDYSKLTNFEEYWIASIGKTLYEKFINNYSNKMWPELKNSQIDDYSWSPKGQPLREGSYDVYPEHDGWLTAYPDTHSGYDKYFDLFLENINVYLNTEISKYNINDKKFYFNSKWNSYDVVVNTISPDILFDKVYGELPFVGRNLELVILPIENLFPNDVYMTYYPGIEKYTRIVEYKKFTNFSSNSTLIGIEYPSMNGKHYPLPLKSKQGLAQKYINELPNNFFSIGRAGSYHYSIDIDDSIQQSMDIFDIL